MDAFGFTNRLYKAEVNMGWHELKKRAEQFKQQTDAAMAGDIMQPTLNYNAQVECRHSYECAREDGAPPLDAGTCVRFIDTPHGIDIYKGTKPVGQLHPDQVNLMRQQQRLAETPGKSVLGVVVQVSKLTSTFTVDVTK